MRKTNMKTKLIIFGVFVIVLTASAGSALYLFTSVTRNIAKETVQEKKARLKAKYQNITKNDPSDAVRMPPTAPIAEQKTITKWEKEEEDKAKKLQEKISNIDIEETSERIATLFQAQDQKVTTEETLKTINKMVKEGDKISQTQLESFAGDIFATATSDTEEFAEGVIEKFALKNLPLTLLANEGKMENLEKALKNELEAYAEEELNKLGNEVIAKVFPQLEGLNLNLTELNEDTLKRSLRSWAVNALTQSYLGPQFAVVFGTLEMLFPKEAEKVHAELRRFDKKYLRPATDKIGDEWDRATKKLKKAIDKLKPKAKLKIKKPGMTDEEIIKELQRLIPGGRVIRP